jgi:hypothetical protein
MAKTSSNHRLGWQKRSLTGKQVSDSSATSNRIPHSWNAHSSAYNPCMVYLKSIFAGLCASALTYVCFLAWEYSNATSLAEERDTIGLIPITSSQSYVPHSPGFGVGFILLPTSTTA